MIDSSKYHEENISSSLTWTQEGEGAVIIVLANVGQNVHVLSSKLLVCTENNKLEPGNEIFSKLSERRFNSVNLV